MQYLSTYFDNYLRNRKQFVKANGTPSSFFSFTRIFSTTGLDPRPATIPYFLNDMFLSNRFFNFLFADDTTGLQKGAIYKYILI